MPSYHGKQRSLLQQLHIQAMQGGGAGTVLRGRSRELTYPLFSNSRLRNFPGHSSEGLLLQTSCSITDAHGMSPLAVSLARSCSRCDSIMGPLSSSPFLPPHHASPQHSSVHPSYSTCCALCVWIAFAVPTDSAFLGENKQT